MRSSSRRCSSSVSTSFRVETRCCASTMRQYLPSSLTASDESASGVQVGDDIDKSGNGQDFFERRAVERRVRVLQPCTGDSLVAADDGIERAEQPDEQHRKLERLGAALEHE